MEQDVGLRRENCSRLRAAPEIMRSPCCIGEEDSQNRRYHQLKCSNGNLGELSLDNIPDFHCKSLPSRSRETNAEDSIVHKRGSMYQSSSEISRIRKLRECRRKVDSVYEGDAFLSFEVVDSSSQPSSSGAYLFTHKKRSSEAKSSVDTACGIHRVSRDFLDLSFRELPDENSRLGRPRLDCSLLRGDQGDDFLEISLEEEITKGPCRNAAPHLLEGGLGKGAGTHCQQKIGVCPNEGNCGEREWDLSNLPKSLSAKVSAVHAAHPSESVIHGVEKNSKARLSPFKKMLDPIMKSKSLRSPSLMEKEDSGSSVTVPVGRKHALSRKSLLSDFSRTEQSPTANCQPDREIQLLTAASSPAHLHAVLKLDSRNGVPVFEFCVEGPEESISARTWKTGFELNWIYTFHSGGKQTRATGRTSKDKCMLSPPIIGQMQASSYLCSEVGKDGILNNSVVTEFVLYDIAHARRSFAVEEKAQCTDTLQPTLCGVVDKSIDRDSPQRSSLMEEQNNARSNSDVSTSCPWYEEDLYPHLEIAATVIQVPFNKDKCKELKAASSPGTIKVVTPSGPHGLPSNVEASPSSLLHRWRYGGGCDCGGWDMACPIVVLGNTYDGNWADSVMKESKRVNLFVQGNKDELPALSMTANGKGQFFVDFHARLSALQAFSVCISLLHRAEASLAIGIEKCKHKLYSGSLKMLLEEEVRHLIEAVTAEEKKKPNKSREKTPPSVVLDPPFSPMGRV